ncbi:MAG: MFS transporter [Caulobacteraceae bacterium]|nr:MFS transporter [Caulobacteraceae bacterium]
MTDNTASQPAGPGLSDGYKAYALLILVIVYTSNFIDRQIIGTVAQAIKADLKISDTEIGLVSGIAFALLYSLLGIPIARLAERFNRVTIISVSLALWSGFTAACGLATNFLQLFLMRIGVGIGEAGCSPAAQSLLSDYYSPRKRATALGIYSLGIPLGSLFGALLGGKIAMEFGWRYAFFIVGLPGLLLAVIAKLSLKEPVRGGYDAAPVAGSSAPSLFAVFKSLFGRPTFRHMAIGATLSSFAGYGVAFFAVPFLLRGPFGLDVATAGGAYGLVGGVAAAAGVFLGGFITDWIGRHSTRGYAVVPGLGFLAAAPLYVLAFQQTTLVGIGAYVIAPLVLHYLYLGPTFAVTHNLVDPRMRATATALLFLPINLVGLGVGPVFVGRLSDFMANRAFAAHNLGDFSAVCPGGSAAAGAAAELAAACGAASFDGVKAAITITAGVFYGWAALHYLLAARTVKRDLEAANAG